MLESGFDIEGMPVDMFYWLGKSSERKVDLKSFVLYVTSTTVKS